MNSGTFILGALNGLIIALLAVGFVLVYKSNRFLNLAQAQLGAVSAMLRLCSTTTTVTPVAWIRRTTSISSPTTNGARPSESSSMHNIFGSSSSALANASCCCSPPESVPAF